MILGVTQNDVRLALAEEDAEDLQSDAAAAPLHEQVTPGLFISLGLELETQQCVQHIMSGL